jgi:hypothetical protein
MRILLFTTILLVLLSPSSFATTSPEAPEAPKSSKVRFALQTHQNAIQAAEKAFRQAQLTAKRQLLVIVEISIIEAARQADATEITKLTALKQQLEKEIQNLAAMNSGKSLFFKVEANKTWQKFIEVKKGQKLHFVAIGQWSSAGPKRMSGPDGYFSLLARIDSGDQVVIGKEYLLTVEKDGILEMRGKDSDTSLDDNLGEVTVEITLK